MFLMLPIRLILVYAIKKIKSKQKKKSFSFVTAESTSNEMLSSIKSLCILKIVTDQPDTLTNGIRHVDGAIGHKRFCKIGIS